MRVTILGAGTLGRVLGVRLAHAGVQVTFVVRTPLPSRVTIERVEHDALSHGPVAQSQELPDSADALLVCLPAEAMDDAMLARIAKVSAPIVTLLPLLPSSWSRISDTLGDHVVAGIPGITGYVRDDGVARYWLPRSAPTLLDASNVDSRDLVAALVRSGVPTEVAPNVARDNQVVTATLLPMAMGLAVAGTVAGAMGDEELVSLVLDAMGEAELLARDLGPSPSWLGLLTKFIGPRMLKVGVGIAERGAPEALHYVDLHFGKGRVGSTRALADEALAVCQSRNIERSALARLRARMPS